MSQKICPICGRSYSEIFDKCLKCNIEACCIHAGDGYCEGCYFEMIGCNSFPVIVLEEAEVNIKILHIGYDVLYDISLISYNVTSPLGEIDAILILPKKYVLDIIRTTVYYKGHLIHLIKYNGSDFAHLAQMYRTAAGLTPEVIGKLNEVKFRSEFSCSNCEKYCLGIIDGIADDIDECCQCRDISLDSWCEECRR